MCSISRCGRQGDIAAGGYKTNDLSSSSSSSTCDCIGICSSGSCNNRCHLGCVVGGEASCEAGTYRLEWRPIRRSSNTSCIVGSGDSSFDPGVHCLERRRRCVASADAGGGDSAERGVAWTGSAATLAASGAAAGSKPRRVAVWCISRRSSYGQHQGNGGQFGALRLQNNLLQQQWRQQQPPTQAAWRRQHQHQR